MNQDKFMEILSLRSSGHVRRWHTIPHSLGQTVAEHSAQALSLLFLLHPNPGINLVKAMLWHDTPERLLGDLPSPAKKLNPALALEYKLGEEEFFRRHPHVMEAMTNLSKEEIEWLNAIDVLELILHCGDQILMGNAHFFSIMDRAKSYLANADTPKEVSDFVLHYKPQRCL